MALWDYFTEEFYDVQTPQAAMDIQAQSAADVSNLVMTQQAVKKQSEKLFGEKQFRNELTKYVTIGAGAIVLILFLKSLK